MHRVVNGLILFIIGLFLSTHVSADEILVRKSLKIEQGLYAGPIPVALPVFYGQKNIKGETLDLEYLLEFDQFDIQKLSPLKNNVLTDGIKWSQRTANDSGCFVLQSSNSNSPEIGYFSTYIFNDQWKNVEIKVTTPHPLQIFVDDVLQTSENGASDKKEQEESTKRYKTSLVTGNHHLVIKTLRDPEKELPWRFNLSIEFENSDGSATASVTDDPTKFVDLKHVLDTPQVKSVSLSADANLVAVRLNQSTPPKDGSESWYEIINYNDGTMLKSFRGKSSFQQLQWSPVKNQFAYVTSGKKGSSLWLDDVEGETIRLLKDVQDFVGYDWSPDGSFIIYSISEKDEREEKDLHKFDGMLDRRPDFRTRSFLYLLDLETGLRKRLTSGKYSTLLQTIHPNGSKILFVTEVEDYTERPYSKKTTWVLDLKTNSLDSLWASPWGSTCTWSADGKKLLVTGAPSLFGDVGVNLPFGITPNDYDGQAYIYTLKSRVVEPITRDFDPSINQAVCQEWEKLLYFNTTDQSYECLYEFDLVRNRVEAVPTGVEIVGSADIKRKIGRSVFIGSGANQYPKVYKYDFASKKSQMLYDPAHSGFEHVQMGKVEPWNFISKEGQEITGRIYYPPDFNAQKTYPCIVYYYGGTSPVSRTFGGRYPKNYWAANGYVVYVLQPSGAIGFGQSFSAKHVNDWGQIVAAEIIEGVIKFLDAHPFVDRKRVGNIGASYGGFMTMLLDTQTDIFAASISHAGISALASYWGEGFWGYEYSGVATANSFPWNEQELYRKATPLNDADKVNTPLLLLHGNQDTNVPPGESIQFYTALKLLGKEVEYIEIDGQNHWVMANGRRRKWSNTIVAWFDKYLKDQDGWWNSIYPEK